MTQFISQSNKGWSAFNPSFDASQLNRGPVSLATGLLTRYETDPGRRALRHGAYWFMDESNGEADTARMANGVSATPQRVPCTPECEDPTLAHRWRIDHATSRIILAASRLQTTACQRTHRRCHRRGQRARNTSGRLLTCEYKKRGIVSLCLQTGRNWERHNS